MLSTVTLSEDYKYNQYKASNLQSVFIDATEAHWIVSNMGANLNLYPILLDGGAGVTLQGGVISGEVPLHMSWEDAYTNSAGIFVRGTEDVVIRDWKIDQAWDAIRIRGAEDFTIERVWLHNVRDDGVENDDGMSGTIRNSLFDGVFVGFSSADAKTADRTREVVSIEKTLVRMETFLYDGKVTHQSPFKVTSKSPSMKIHDSVFAIEVVDHIGQARLATAWGKVIDASGNYFLNLSDTPLPKSYPMPPKGFTVLQGAEARAFWDKARADWIAEFKEGAVAVSAAPCPD